MCTSRHSLACARIRRHRAREAHNPEVTGSNPVPATKRSRRSGTCGFFHERTKSARFGRNCKRIANRVRQALKGKHQTGQSGGQPSQFPLPAGPVVVKSSRPSVPMVRLYQFRGGERRRLGVTSNEWMTEPETRLAATAHAARTFDHGPRAVRRASARRWYDCDWATREEEIRTWFGPRKLQHNDSIFCDRSLGGSVAHVSAAGDVATDRHLSDHAVDRRL
jgi:hypothetical protein